MAKMRSVPPYLAAVALLVGGACGRMGYDAIVVSDGGPDDQAASDAAPGVVGDGAVTDGDGAACGSVAGLQCTDITVVLSPTGSTMIGGNFSVFGAPLEPICGSGVVAEHRVRVVGPDVPTRAVFQVDSDQDVVLSVYTGSCQGAVTSCTEIPAGAPTIINVELGADEEVIVSAASVGGCGNVNIAVESQPPGGA